MRTIEIEFSTANDGQWGAETTDRQAALIAAHCADLAEAYARRHFLEIDLIARTTRWPEPRNDESEEAAAIMEYISRHWPEEELWQPEFDADAYVAAHPR